MALAREGWTNAEVSQLRRFAEKHNKTDWGILARKMGKTYRDVYAQATRLGKTNVGIAGSVDRRWWCQLPLYTSGVYLVKFEPSWVMKLGYSANLRQRYANLKSTRVRGRPQKMKLVGVVLARNPPLAGRLESALLGKQTGVRREHFKYVPSEIARWFASGVKVGYGNYSAHVSFIRSVSWDRDSSKVEGGVMSGKAPGIPQKSGKPVIRVA